MLHAEAVKVHHCGGRRYEALYDQAEAARRPYTELAALLGCDPDEIAVVQSATTAWQQAFFGLPFQKGDRILTRCSPALTRECENFESYTALSGTRLQHAWHQDGPCGQVRSDKALWALLPDSTYHRCLGILGNSSSLLQSSPNPHAGAHASVGSTASCKIGIPNSTETRQAAAAHLPPLPQSLSNAHPNVHHCSRCGGNSAPCLQFVLRAEDGFIHVYQRLAHREAVFLFRSVQEYGSNQINFLQARRRLPKHCAECPHLHRRALPPRLHVSERTGRSRTSPGALRATLVGSLLHGRYLCPHVSLVQLSADV